MPAVGGGGALFANGTAVVLLGNKFRNNSARSYGGGALLSFGAPFQPPPDPPAADDDTVPTPPPTPAPLGPTLLGAAVRIEGNVMEGNEGALVGGAVGAVFWGSATGGSVRFERNDVRDCAAGAGTGAGGLGVLYLGACSVRNAHAVRGNRFARCSGGSSGSGGSGGAYHTSGGGGGGAGGFAVVYACSTADKGAAAEASNNTHDLDKGTCWWAATPAAAMRSAPQLKTLSAAAAAAAVGSLLCVPLPMPHSAAAAAAAAAVRWPSATTPSAKHQKPAHLHDMKALSVLQENKIRKREVSISTYDRS